MLHGGHPRNKYEAQIQIKIIELQLRELNFSGEEIEILQCEEMKQYLAISQMRAEMQQT